jgi:Glycosyltransferase 61
VAPPPPSPARRLFWRTRPYGRLHVDRIEQPFTDAHLDLPSDTDPEALAALAEYSSSPWPEWVLEIDGRHVFEPACGWAVRGVRTRVDRSLVEGVRCHPAPGRYLAKRIVRGRRLRVEDCVVSLRTAYEGNYWHLFDDVLARLAQLDEFGVAPETPVVVSRTLWERPYFQHLLARGPLQTRTWIVQGRLDFVRARRSYVSKSVPPDRARFERVLHLIGAEATPSRRERRLFVRRAEGQARSLRNSDELERIAAGAGFEAIEPGELPPEEQITLFSEARSVVGVHGAGLANVLFRAGCPLDVLELLSPTWFGPQYFWLARAFGYGYRPILGEAAGPDGAFRVSPDVFERELAKIVGG